MSQFKVPESVFVPRNNTYNLHISSNDKRTSGNNDQAVYDVDFSQFLSSINPLNRDEVYELSFGFISKSGNTFNDTTYALVSVEFGAMTTASGTSDFQSKILGVIRKSDDGTYFSAKPGDNFPKLIKKPASNVIKVSIYDQDEALLLDDTNLHVMNDYHMVLSFKQLS